MRPPRGDLTSYFDRKWKELVSRVVGYPLNQEQFSARVTIPAASELAIDNQLNVVPSSFIITSDDGNGIIKRGDTTWTTSSLYLKNVSSSSDAVATVLFVV